MKQVRKLPALVFLIFLCLALAECGRRGTPTGGPKDTTPPVLIRAEPENLTTDFKADKIRLYFDEYILLTDVQEQLIISPPLKYPPEITPLGSASKYIEIVFKDTLLENTTYTLNFGQSIVDNNERNPNNFLTYVFSTGGYIDSLELRGVVKDAFNKEADPFISVMLYAIDTAYTDSTVYQKPPYYITNTLDSAIIWNLKNLKAGTYALVGVKDEDKNNFYSPLSDKIGFIADTVQLPTDSIYVLNLFKEVPEYSASVPTFGAANKIIFGYKGEQAPGIRLLSEIPDSISTLIKKEPGKDSLNFWFTPFEMDSLLFELRSPVDSLLDTVTVKRMRIAADSLVVNPSKNGTLIPGDTIALQSNIPLVVLDTSLIEIMDKDSVMLKPEIRLDTAAQKVDLLMAIEPEQNYRVAYYPGAIQDFFGNTIDTLNYTFTTRPTAEYGHLKIVLEGQLSYPLLVHLTDDRGTLQRESYLEGPRQIEFQNLSPGNYFVRVIFDANQNGRWDTGNYLRRIQPEKVVYHRQAIEMRANWEENRSILIE